MTGSQSTDRNRTQTLLITSILLKAQTTQCCIFTFLCDCHESLKKYSTGLSVSLLFHLPSPSFILHDLKQSVFGGALLKFFPWQAYIASFWTYSQSQNNQNSKLKGGSK